MTKLKSAVSLLIIILFFSGCQTVKDKTDAIVEKENEKLSKFLGKSASELQMELGKPDEDFKNAKGNFEFVYNSKKYLCLLYTSPSPRDAHESRMPSSA